jgi:hypothetical protein
MFEPFTDKQCTSLLMAGYTSGTYRGATKSFSAGTNKPLCVFRFYKRNRVIGSARMPIQDWMDLVHFVSSLCDE